jgi:M6 family metalloprotease-like protein
MKWKGIVFAVSIVLINFISAGLPAAYFEFFPAEVTQPDGEVIKCYSSGDEFFNWLHDEAGYTIIAGEDGYYYYGIRDGEQVTASEYRVNSVAPSQAGIEPRVVISERVYQERRRVFEEPMKRSSIRAPHTGIMNNLVIYIRFSDDPEFTIPRSEYDNDFNDTSGSSVRNYFQEVSYNQLDMISHHYPICDLTTNLSYQDSNPRSYYQPYHEVNNPNGYSGGDSGTERRTREHTLLQNAILAVRDQVPAAMNIDGDDDGHVDNVSFIIRGNSGSWAQLLWAHRWALYTYDVRINNKRVWDYTFQPENQTSVRVLCHELFHALGAPDLYHYTSSGFTPVGPWDLMQSGFVHMGAWMKYKYADQNWITNIPEITTSGTYTLNPLTSATNNVFKIASPYTASEFFILEYRKQTGLYESNLPGSGLLIYRIDPSINGNAQGPPDEVYLYRLNGTPDTNGTVNSAHYSSNTGRIEINDFSTNPVSFLANGDMGGLHIHSIGAAENTISFTVNIDLLPVTVTDPLPYDDSFFSYLNTEFSWTGGAGANGYNLSLWQENPFQYVIEDLFIENNSYQLTEPLQSLTTYYWQVDAVNLHGTAAGDIWSFTTGTEEGPATVDVGDGTGTSYYIPLNMYWKNSLSQTIYYTGEIENTGTVFKLSYYNNFTSDLQNKPVKIWLGETALTDLSSGWIPSTALELVFDGTLNFPSGENEIDILLQNPYQYEGQNLVVMVNRPMDSQYHSSNDKFYVTTTTDNNRTRYLQSDTTAFDPANPSGGTLSSLIANIKISMQSDEADQPEILLTLPEVNKAMAEEALNSVHFPVNNPGSGELEYRISISPGSRNRGASDRSIEGSTLTCDQDSFSAGSTIDWTFTVFNASTDNEWLRDIRIDFPDGVTVNSATPFTGGSGGTMNPDITSGNGIEIHWHGSGSSNWGVVYPNETAVATVNVSISPSFSGSISLPYQIDGDIWGLAPHTVTGTITLEIDYENIDWLTVTPLTGTVEPGMSLPLLLEFDSQQLILGEYSKTIVITSNDPDNPRLFVPVNLTVTDQILSPPQSLTATPRHSRVELEWEEPAAARTRAVLRDDARLQVLGYNIYRNGLRINSETVAETLYEDNDVSNGESYQYYITTLYEIGESEASNTAVAVPYDLHTPLNLTANLQNRLVELEWEAPLPLRRGNTTRLNSRLVLTGYNVYRDDLLLNPEPVADEFYSDSDVEPGISYQYFVTALYDEGESEPSNSIDVVPFELPLPYGLTAAAIDSYIHVNWQEPLIGTWIHWDNGENYTGIGNNGPLQFKAAIRFSPEDLAAMAGPDNYLTKISFFPRVADALYELNVWTGGTASEPGTLVLEQPVSSPQINTWNTIELLTPVPIDTEQELWIGYSVATQTGLPAGCDSGPAVNGSGNMMFFNGEWTTLLALGSSLDYNWNIQGYVENPEEEVPRLSESFVLLGFNLYRDGEPLNTEPLTAAWYNDYDISSGQTYSYYVTALYPEGESDPTETVELTVQFVPEINVNIEDISKEIFAGETDDSLFLVYNEGNGALFFTIDITYTRGEMLSRLLSSDEAREETAWLSVYPSAGAVPVSDSLRIDLDFDLSELTEGDYEAQLNINCNDPETPQIIIPVYLAALNPELSPPENITISLEEGWLIISWDEVTYADYYLIEQTDDISSEYTVLDPGIGLFTTEGNRVIWSREMNAEEPRLFFRVKAVRETSRQR